MRLREYARNTVTLKEPVFVTAYMKEREYLLSIDTDKLLAGFRECAGIPKQVERYYGGWESSELSGHTLGHYMVALAQMYATEQSGDIRERLEYILEELARSQGRSGYLFTSGAEVFDKLEQGGTTHKPWYTMHKILTGLIAVYKLAGFEQALTIAKKLGDWIVNRVSLWTDEERRNVLCSHDGGMNDCLYELYKVSGYEKYAEAAEKFDEPELFEKIAMGQNILAERHATNLISKILGAVNRYMAFGESQVRSLETAKRFFAMVTEHHTYITGGNGKSEHFGEPDTLGGDLGRFNCEACGTYGMLKLAARLYSVTGDKCYMDYYEQTLMNAVLGSQNPMSGMTTFFQPMATGYFKTFGAPYSGFWCCTGTGMESFTDLNSNIYHTTGNGLYVNLYVSSVLNHKDSGVKLTQKADFENVDSAEFLLEFDGEETKDVALYFRIPKWSRQIDITVNGVAVKTFIKNGYICPEGRRRNGDRVVIKLNPMVELHTLPDAEHCVAATYGPFVLAAGLGREDMTTEQTPNTNITLPTGKVAVRKRFVLREGIKLSKWLADCNKNFVKKDGEPVFSLRGTDAEEAILFTPFYKIYNERYGIYFEYYDRESLPDGQPVVVTGLPQPDEEPMVVTEQPQPDEEPVVVTEQPQPVEEPMAEEGAHRTEEEHRFNEEEEQQRMDEDRLAELAEAKRREEEVSRLVEMLAAERSELEEGAKKIETEATKQRLMEEAEIAEIQEAARRAEAEVARLRREAEEEERLRLAAEEAEKARQEAEAEAERARLAAEAEAEAEAARLVAEEEARKAAAQSVAEAERAAELAEAEARKAAAQKVADAEREAELAEAEARKAAAQKVADAEREAELAEAEARKAAAQKVADAEHAAELAEAEARKAAAQSVAEAEREAELAEAEARKAAAQKVADAEREAELAEAKRKEEEENLQAAKIAAERAEIEEATRKAEAEAARHRREAEEEERLRLAAEEEAERARKEAEAEAERARLAAEEEERRKKEEAEEQKRIEAEARMIAAQKVADAEHEAEFAEAEARKAAAKSVADAERAAELAEAKRKEEEGKLEAAKLAAERAELEAETRKAEAEAEAAKATAVEELLKQEKANQEAEKVHRASEKAANKNKKKETKKRLRKQRRAYRDFSAVKVVLGVVGALALIVVLYLFATPIAKGCLTGKNAVDTFFAEKLPKVAEFLKVKGNGYDMPVFKENSVYLKEDAENYVQTTAWPQGYTASAVRLNGKQYICLEGNGLKLYYLNELTEDDSKHVYLEKGDIKAMYFMEYSFDNPESLCPITGVFNTAGVEQYMFGDMSVEGFRILDADTLAECRMMLQPESIAHILKVSECKEVGQNIRIDMTVEGVPYAFEVMKKGGLSVPEGYKIGLDGIHYKMEGNEIGFEAYAMSAGMYLGKMTGKMSYAGGGYIPTDVSFCAFAEEDYGGADPVLTATHYKGAEQKRFEVIGDRGEQLLVAIRSDIEKNSYDDSAFRSNENGDLRYVKNGTILSVKGIEVSEEQGRIDWAKVAESGVKYAMIRVGERGPEKDDKCTLDAEFSRNAKRASDAGIAVGVTFVSRATTAAEAKEEAQYVLQQIKDYDISWPVVLDMTAAAGDAENRAGGLSAHERTKCAETFLKTIASEGYTPVIYADAVHAALELDLAQLSGYDVWYGSEGTEMSYPYHFSMWKYTVEANVPGVPETAGKTISLVDYGAQKEE